MKGVTFDQIEKQYAKLGMKMPGAKPAAKLPEIRKNGGFKSGTERDYAKHLETLKHVGELQWWAYEPFKMRLADGTFFTVDFAVMGNAGLTFDETKGGFMREAARVRLNVAADIYPFRFRLVKWEAGQWTYKNISGLFDRISVPVLPAGANIIKKSILQRNPNDLLRLKMRERIPQIETSNGGS